MSGESEKTLEERMTAVEEAVGTMLDLMENLTKSVANVEKTAVTKPKGLFGGKRTKTAILDTKTKTVHASKSAVGKALYAEIENGDPGDRFIWYKLMAKFPDRFTELADDDPQAIKCWEDEKAQIAADQVAAQAKLDAEAKAADKTAPAPAGGKK